MKLLDKIINRAKSAIGKGETPDPKAEFARTKTDAEMELRDLLRKEKDLQEQLDMCVEGELVALRKGDDRAYNVSHNQFERVSAALQATRTTSDAFRNMLGAMETQGYMGSIVTISQNMSQMQKHLGLDSTAMKDAVHSIKEGMASAEELSNSIESISDMMAGDESIARRDTHKAELLAKIQAEREVQAMGDKIESEIKDIL